MNDPDGSSAETGVGVEPSSYEYRLATPRRAAAGRAFALQRYAMFSRRGVAVRYFGISLIGVFAVVDIAIGEPLTWWLASIVLVVAAYSALVSPAGIYLKSLSAARKNVIPGELVETAFGERALWMRSPRGTQALPYRMFARAFVRYGYVFFVGAAGTHARSMVLPLELFPRERVAWFNETQIDAVEHSTN